MRQRSQHASCHVSSHCTIAVFRAFYCKNVLFDRVYIVTRRDNTQVLLRKYVIAIRLKIRALIRIASTVTVQWQRHTGICTHSAYQICRRVHHTQKIDIESHNQSDAADRPSSLVPCFCRAALLMGVCCSVLPVSVHPHAPEFY